MGAERVQRQIQPPRPLNAWIIYRREKAAQLPAPKEGEPKRSQAEISRMISRMWRVETEAVKAEFEKKAEVTKAEHQARYPNYRFQPAKKSEKGKLRKWSRVDREKDTRKSRRAAPYPPTAPAHQPGVLQYSRPPHSSQLAPFPPLSAASSPVSSPRLVPTLHLDQGPPVYDHPSGSYYVPATRQGFRPSFAT
jgi:HMG (high mobility group) box